MASRWVMEETRENVHRAALPAWPLASRRSSAEARRSGRSGVPRSPAGRLRRRPDMRDEQMVSVPTQSRAESLSTRGRQPARRARAGRQSMPRGVDRARSAVSMQTRILNLMPGLQRGLGLTYLLISHDLPVIPCGRGDPRRLRRPGLCNAQIRREAGSAVHPPGEPSAGSLASPAEPVASGPAGAYCRQAHTGSDEASPRRVPALLAH